MRLCYVQRGRGCSDQGAELQLLDLPAKGLLLSFVPADNFTLTSGEDALTTYEFDAHKIAHRFCMICGCQPFAAGKNADASEMRSVNLRSVHCVNLEALQIQHYDGASK